MNRVKLVIALFAGLLGGYTYPAVDPLTEIKQGMRRAACCRFEFISALESEVFDSVDSTLGTALIARDGRYQIEIGSDVYTRTAEHLFSYSRVQNQVTEERLGAAARADEEIGFITRLDDFYHTNVISPGLTYLLLKHDSSAVGLPDSLTLYLAGDPPQLDRLEYLDINEEVNRVIFLSSEYLRECNDSALEPRFPDSVEIIKLY